MPYEWTTAKDGANTLTLWPYRSLPRRGFVTFIGGTALLLSIPLLTVLGSPVLWGLLPFFVLTIAGMYWALQRSYRDAEIVEQLTLWPNRACLTRTGPRTEHHEWEANPHWIKVVLHQTGGPVPHYITLKGGPREVELGAFLSEEERIALAGELRQVLAQMT